MPSPYLAKADWGREAVGVGRESARRLAWPSAPWAAGK